MKILNNNLYIYLNEMYIIDELVKIFEIFEFNDKKNLDLFNTISQNLRDNSLIIQKMKQIFLN